jgi:two-component system nitrate/nitrite response regulator NarL
VSKTNIYACESQPIVLEGLVKVFAETPDLHLCGHAPSPVEAMPRILEAGPRVVLLDQAGGLRSSFRFLGELREAAPQCSPVLWVAEMAEIESFRALQLGARGILKRTLPVVALLECLRAVALGSIWMENSISNQVVGFLNRRTAARLTPREREIVELVARGAKNKEIAQALGITPGTVKVHLMHIFEKTGVKDRFELAMQGPRLLGLSSSELIRPEDDGGPMAAARGLAALVPALGGRRAGYGELDPAEGPVPAFEEIEP